ncbi:MAG: DUF433 domain-containing protein [Phycisphaerales bacterium]
MALLDRITVNPAQMNGQPCIRGMRRTVRSGPGVSAKRLHPRLLPGTPSALTISHINAGPLSRSDFRT